MGCQLIDGKKVSLEVKDALKGRMAVLKEQYGRVPCLAVIIVGENPASQSYVRGKVKACEYVGMESRLVALPETVSEAELLSVVDGLNRDAAVDGVLVQLPLPAHIDEDKVINGIVPEKDVDGFHPRNVADLWLGAKCTVPCTPKGVMHLLDAYGIDPAGKLAVVIGRSNIVGKPVAKLLLDRNATVVMAHSRTKNLRELTLQADILVVAVGRAGLVTGDMVKPGAAVIDVGINRGADGKLHGDVDFDSAAAVAGYLTPVPGGVGPMTIAMLMENTVECYLGRISTCSLA